MLTTTPHFSDARKRFHATLISSAPQTRDAGIPSNADEDSTPSRVFAEGVIKRLGLRVAGLPRAGRASNEVFKQACAEFVKSTFGQLGHLRSGTWQVIRVEAETPSALSRFEEYSSVAALYRAAEDDAGAAALLQSDYTITPDIIVARLPESDDAINAPRLLVDETVSKRSSLRKSYNSRPILHASISCKWTLRSDRAQNSRAEALNLIRNRKGHLPHIVVVTGEPLPGRLASLAFGTGDIDCVYHFALDELQHAVGASIYEDAKELLKIMVDGKRLKDISDLPLDLAV